MKIRPATAADLPAITEIADQASAAEQTTARPLTAPERTAWFASHAISDRYGVWVVVDRGTVQGYGTVGRYQVAGAATTAAQMATILAPNAQPEWTAELVDFLITWTGKMGFTYLIGQAITNQEADNRLLLQRGFIKWGQTPDIIQLGQATTSVSYYTKYLK